MTSVRYNAVPRRAVRAGGEGRMLMWLAARAVCIARRQAALKRQSGHYADRRSAILSYSTAPLPYLTRWNIRTVSKTM